MRSRRPARTPDPRLPVDQLLSVRQLAGLVTAVAAQPDDWRHLLRFPERQRWYQPVHATPTVEVWLLTWPQDSSTELHDHGASAGALCVVEGELEEVHVAARGQLRGRALHPGDVEGFSPGYVHDVRTRRREPAVSVHAYSPPLSSMTYYESADRGLVAVRTERFPQSAPLALPGLVPTW